MSTRSRQALQFPSKFLISGISLALFVFATLFLIQQRQKGYEPDFPGPIAIGAAMPRLLSGDIVPGVSVWSALGVTVSRVALSTLAALAVGMLAAVFLASWKPVWKFAQAPVDFLRSIPITFLISTAAVFRKDGAGAAELPWMLSAIPCSMMMILEARQGVQRISQDRAHVFAALMGTQSKVLRFKFLILPSMVPELFAGLRLSVSYSIVVVSVLEYMNVGCARTGFGAVVLKLQDNRAFDQLYAAIIVFGLLGYATNYTCEYVESRFSGWRKGRSDAVQGDSTPMMRDGSHG